MGSVVSLLAIHSGSSRESIHEFFYSTKHYSLVQQQSITLDDFIGNHE